MKVQTAPGVSIRNHQPAPRILGVQSPEPLLEVKGWGGEIDTPNWGSRKALGFISKLSELHVQTTQKARVRALVETNHHRFYHHHSPRCWGFRRIPLHETTKKEVPRDSDLNGSI